MRMRTARGAAVEGSGEGETQSSKERSGVPCLRLFFVSTRGPFSCTNNSGTPWASVLGPLSSSFPIMSRGPLLLCSSTFSCCEHDEP